MLDTIERALGVKDGGITKDMVFSLDTVACLGTCFLAPVMMVDGNYYGQVAPDRVKKIIDQYE